MERFWTKVDRRSDEECWPWLATLDSRGRGRFRIDGKTIQPIRMAYRLLIGPEPEGLDADHLCRNPSCVNPNHVEFVPHHVNVTRAMKYTVNGQARRTHCSKGHEYTKENTRIDSRGWRECKQCKREWKGRW